MPSPLVLRRVPIADLVPDPANPRIHGEENLEAIAASLRRFGQAEPLVVQADTMRVVAGHGRLEAMRRLGWTEVDVVEVDVSSIDATALAIALNRTSEVGAAWDEGALARLLGELRNAGSLDGIGFTDAQVDELVAKLAAEQGPAHVDDPGPEEPPEHPVSNPGDLWILGDHRLLAGDSMKPGDVARVMGEDKAALVATDPPYLVDYTGERPNESGKDWSDSYREIEIEDAEGFFRAVFRNIVGVVAPKAAIYAWHAHKRCGLIQRIWQDLGILDHQQVVWVKPTPVFGRVYWHFRHEPCMMGWVQGSKPDHDGRHEFDSVWQVDWDGKARVVGNEHPTEKPVELFARPMRKHTRPGDVVFEPFSGSGSQIIAAERERRRCRAIEISVPFVDVAVRRWEKATGKQAVLEGTGQTFDEVAAERCEGGVVVDAGEVSASTG